MEKGTPSVLTSVLHAWRTRPCFVHHLVFLIFLAVLAGTTIHTGVVPLLRYPFDLFLLVGNGWRVLYGQRPHIDFSSGYGPVTFLLSAAGLKLAAGSAAGVGYGNALFSIVTGVWAYALLLRRMGGIPAVLAAAMVATLGAAPFRLGDDWNALTHAMNYNRYGYALLALVLFECFPLARAEGDRGLDFVGGLSTGAACMILLFVKANNFVVAAGLVALSWLLWSHNTRRRLLGLAMGAGVVGLLFLWYLRFDVAAVARDLRMIAETRGRTFPYRRMFAGALRTLDGFVQLAALSLFVSAVRTAPSWPKPLFRPLVRWRTGIVAAALFGVNALLYSTNNQGICFPLGVAFAFILLHEILSEDFPLPASYAAILALFALVLIGPPFATDIAGVAKAAIWKSHQPPGKVVSRLPGKGFETVLLLDDPDTADVPGNGRSMSLYLADGLDLLRLNLRPGETVMTFDGFDPFSFALGIAPPWGNTANAAATLMFDERSHPSPEFFFGGADLVMFPKDPANDLLLSFVPLQKLYGNYLESTFEVASESPRWRLYRRRDSATRHWRFSGARTLPSVPSRSRARSLAVLGAEG